MPSPICSQCNCTESFLWKLIGENQHICNDCFDKNSKNVKSEPSTVTTASTLASAARAEERKARLRKSTRSTRYSGKNGNGLPHAAASNGSGVASANTNKAAGVKSGRGRRSLFRRPPMKAPVISATTTSVKSLFYKVQLIGFNERNPSNSLIRRARTYKSEILCRCATPTTIHFTHKYGA